MKRVLLLVSIGMFLLMIVACSGGHEEDAAKKATRIHQGETAPGFSVDTIDGRHFSLEEEKGKIVLLSFFATSCPPCREELPHLEREIWARYRGEHFSLLAIGREHTTEELKPFAEKFGLSFPMAADPGRKIYSKYAEAYIPRLFLIGGDGKVLFESSGFTPEEFENMRKTLGSAIEKLPAEQNHIEAPSEPGTGDIE